MAKKKIKAIVFDVDGVLIDVSMSYRMAIKKTAEFFLGRMLSMEEVEKVKNRGVNDDRDAAELLIQENGGDFRKEVIVKKFEEYYLGRNFDGLVKNEKCLVNDKFLKKLKKYKLGIFTGRPKEEADYRLKRFKMNKFFNAVVVMGDVKEKKPGAEGLLKLIKKLKVKNNETVYVGDNLADLMTAKNADVNFIGVVPPGTDNVYLKNLLKSEGAEMVLNDVNDILKVI